MPTPLYPVTIPVPGNQGLMSQLESAHLPVQWATTANNCVIDEAGRLAARKGWEALTSPAISGTPTIKVIHEYIDDSGTKIIVSSANGKLYDGTTTLTDRTAALSIGTDNWKFSNFNGKCLAWQKDQSTKNHQLVKTGSGNWAAISFDALSGGSHTWGDAMCTAYGRVWTTNSNGTVVKYSSVLDETDFASDQGNASNTVGTTAGVIDLKTVWVAGMDTVVAIAAFNGYIIFFGKRQILIYGDATGMASGALDPNSSSFYLVEAITGRGCIARDSVQEVGDDLIYLSDSGVFSFGRVIQEKSNPQYDETANIRDEIVSYISGETASLIKSSYNSSEGFYLLTFPSYALTVCMDMRQRSESGGRKCTLWTGNVPGGICSTEAGVLYLGQAGVIGEYTGYTDNASAYTLEYYSGWFPINEESRLAVLKKVFLYLYTTSTSNVTLYWYWDYSSTVYSETRSVSGNSVGLYGTGTYGTSLYGGGGTLAPVNYMGKGFGNILKFGIAVPINGPEFAVQQISLYAKAGRV